MDVISATRAKQNFGEVLDAAMRSPVAIGKHGKVRAILSALEHWNAQSGSAHGNSEQKLARAQQAIVERDRLIRHHRIALDLLTLPAADARRLVRDAQEQVRRWREQRLCSQDYIERWERMLSLPLRQLARSLVDDHEGWGTALRQNSPWVGLGR